MPADWELDVLPESYRKQTATETPVDNQLQIANQDHGMESRKSNIEVNHNDVFTGDKKSQRSLETTKFLD